MFASLRALSAGLAAIPLSAVLMAAGGTQVVPLAVGDFRNVDHEADHGHYYRVLTEAGPHLYLAADYQPKMDPETLGIRVPEKLRKAEKRLTWRWRVRVFPKDGDECFGPRGDSAAAVILTFRNGLKWILLKYIWSEVEPQGTVCDKRSNLFVGRQTTVLERGGPLGVWKDESLDPKLEYVRHFGGKIEDVPDFAGIGVITDGDNLKTVSAADYADFVLEAEARP